MKKLFFTILFTLVLSGGANAGFILENCKNEEERAATRKAKAKKKKADLETMRELEKYQEDRNREREKKYGLKPIDER